MKRIVKSIAALALGLAVAGGVQAAPKGGGPVGGSKGGSHPSGGSVHPSSSFQSAKSFHPGPSKFNRVPSR